MFEKPNQASLSFGKHNKRRFQLHIVKGTRVKLRSLYARDIPHIYKRPICVFIYFIFIDCCDCNLVSFSLFSSSSSIYAPTSYYWPSYSMDEKTEKTDPIAVCEEIVKAPLSRSGTLTSAFEYNITTNEDGEGPEPTEEEYKTLREVSDKVPYAAYLVILIEFCERFTYYGLSGPFQNYIQYPDPGECESLYSFLSFPLFLFFIPSKLNIMLLPLLQILPNSPVLWVKDNKSLQL